MDPSIYMGFSITGDLSQSGVYPTDKKVDPSPGTHAIWTETRERYKTKAAGSGWPNAQTLWTEATEEFKFNDGISSPFRV